MPGSGSQNHASSPPAGRGGLSQKQLPAAPGVDPGHLHSLLRWLSNALEDKQNQLPAGPNGIQSSGPRFRIVTGCHGEGAGFESVRRIVMSFNFEGKVAVVTGGASGIGAATVETLCRAGRARGRA